MRVKEEFGCFSMITIDILLSRVGVARVIEVLNVGRVGLKILERGCSRVTPMGITTECVRTTICKKLGGTVYYTHPYMVEVLHARTTVHVSFW